MYLVKNISKAPIYPASGECAPGGTCELTVTELVLLKSNGRVEDYDYPEPPKAPSPAPKTAPKKKAATKGPAAQTDFL